MYRKETCLSQAPEQTVVFIFGHVTTSGENKTGQNKISHLSQGGENMTTAK